MGNRAVVIAKSDMDEDIATGIYRHGMHGRGGVKMYEVVFSKEVE